MVVLETIFLVVHLNQVHSSVRRVEVKLDRIYYPAFMWRVRVRVDRLIIRSVK